MTVESQPVVFHTSNDEPDPDAINIFEFENSMWQSFSGAEPFAEGKEPVHMETQLGLWVCSANGVEVFVGETFVSEDIEDYALRFAIPYQWMGVALLKELAGVKSVEQLKEMGFEHG
jgi:hypothetical protein